MIEPSGSQEQAVMTLRDIGLSDLDWLLALNNASVPHVNGLEREGLADILAMAGYARALFQNDRPSGALLALWPGQSYASSNYRWFEQHHAGFLYIDRVMIDASHRKGGQGRRLYEDIERFAHDHGASALACEVNREPPNPVSMGFHKTLGFRPVGTLDHNASSKSVMLLMKTL